MLPFVWTTTGERMAGLVGRLTSPFSTKIGYIGDNVLDRDLFPPA